MDRVAPLEAAEVVAVSEAVSAVVGRRTATEAARIRIYPKRLSLSIARQRL